MSIVGPRPALPREVEQYGEYEKQRLYVTPGCRMCGAAVPQAPVLTAPALSAGSSITAAMGGALGVQQPTVCEENAAMSLLRMHSLVT